MNIFKPSGAFAPGSSEDASSVASETARWQKDLFAPTAAGKKDRKKFVTDVGIPVEPLYTPADLEQTGFDYLRDLGFPGEYPFTRGDRPGMNRTDPFVISAYSGFGEAQVCNERFKKVIEIGAEQILVALDLPTQCGYDSDHEMAAAEVGNVGVAIDSLADVEILFDGIPADSIKRIGTLGNSIGPIVLALWAALGEKQGIAWDRYTVNLQNDPLKEYIARGTQILPPEPAAKLASDAVAWCVEHAPNWSPMTVCVNHINAGGAGSSMGTAIALANARHYIDLLLKQGYSIDQVAPLLHMFPGRTARFLRVDRQFARAAPHLGAHDEGAIRRHQAGGDGAAHHRLRPRARGASRAAQQHPTHRFRHVGLCARRGELCLSCRLRRGGVDAEREFRARGLAHTADHCQRARLHRHHRSAWRLLLCRNAHRPGRAANPRWAWRRSSRSAARCPRSAPDLPAA